VVTLDLERCEALVKRTNEGDSGAWKELVEILWPVWLKLVRNSRDMGSLAKAEDHVHNAVLDLIEKFGPERGTTLALYPAWRERNPDKTFEDWLRIVTAFTVRDYVRRALGRSRTKDPELPSAKRLLNEFVTSPAIDEVGGLRPAMTMAQTARELLTFAKSRLSADQYAGLIAWLEGAELDEIGAELSLRDPEGGRKVLRSAIAVLRRHFAPAATARG
jgi:hypothetical protein